MLATRKLLGITAIIALILPCMGQAYMSMGLGIKGGMNFANATIKDNNGKTVNTNTLNGYSIGGLVEFGVHNPWSLVLEPSYVKNGAEFKDFDGKVNLSYLQLPVLVKAKFGSPDLHLFIFAGPNFGLNLDATGSAKFGALSTTWNAKDDIKNMDIAGDVGAGVSVKLMPNVHASIDARYTYGFTNIIESNSNSLDSWNSRDIKLLAGLTFHLPE